MPISEDATDYTIFGLRVRSEIPLPELPALPSSSEADVRIGIGPAATVKEGSVATFVVDGIGRYQVIGGREIVVEPVAGAHPRNLRLYLLGTAMGMLIHQRGLLPLHANAVEIEGKAVAFMGPSGSGKSTLAAWFHDNGFRIIADDVCVIRFDDEGVPLVWPGLPRLRLWREMLEMTNRDPAQFAHSYAGAEDWEKYDVPLPADRMAASATQLAAIHLLEFGDRFRITSHTGVAAAEALFANTYRGAEVRRSGKPQTHWETCLRLIERVPLFRLQRPRKAGQIDRQGNALIAHARETLMLDRSSHRSG